MKKFLKGSLLAIATVCGMGVFADDTVTLPDVGVDISAMITAAMDELAPILLVAIGATFAIIVIKWGISWARGIGSRRG